MDNKSTNTKQIEEYLAPLSELGIQKGDVLLVTSDITKLYKHYYRLYGERLTMDDIIDYLQGLLGEEGTLLFPTYNWDYCNGETFDYHNTPGQTGSLGNAALKRNDFKRTQHPIYSFAVWGKDQALLCGMNNTSSFGADSPFAYFDRVHAKQLIIDVPMHITNGMGFTYPHYVEQKSGVVQYRYEKNFTAKYIDAEGKTEERTYSMFVRSYELETRNDFAPLHAYLRELGVEKHFCVNDIHYYMIDLHAAVDPIMDDVVNNKSRKFCIYKGQ